MINKIIATVDTSQPYLASLAIRKKIFGHTLGVVNCGHKVMNKVKERILTAISSPQAKDSNPTQQSIYFKKYTGLLRDTNEEVLIEKKTATQAQQSQVILMIKDLLQLYDTTMKVKDNLNATAEEKTALHTTITQIEKSLLKYPEEIKTNFPFNTLQESITAAKKALADTDRQNSYESVA